MIKKMERRRLMGKPIGRRVRGQPDPWKSMGNGKNGKKWKKMEKNGEKWRKMEGNGEAASGGRARRAARRVPVEPLQVRGKWGGMENWGVWGRNKVGRGVKQIKKWNFTCYINFHVFLIFFNLATRPGRHPPR